MRAEFVAGSVAFPLELLVGGVVPFGGIATGTVHCLVTALPFRPNRARRQARDSSHSLQPAQRLESVHRLAARLGIFRDSVAIRLCGQIIAAVAAVVVTYFTDEFLERLIPFKLVHEAKPLL